MSAPDLAARLAILRELAARLAEAKAAVDAEIRQAWTPGDRLTALLPDGRPVGTVTLAKGRTSARLVDADAYEAWVRRVHPEAIETVERINPDFLARTLNAAKKLGTTVDPDTGEEVPGVDIVQGDPYPVVRTDADAPDLIAQAWASGALAPLLDVFRPQLGDGDGAS